MRILAFSNMYPPHHLGGYELVAKNVCSHLVKAGHQVEVLTTDTTFPEAKVEAHKTGEVVNRKLRWYWRDHQFPKLTSEVVKQLERQNQLAISTVLEQKRPDVVIFFALGGMSLKLLEQIEEAQIPRLYVIHDLWPVYGPIVDQGWSGRRFQVEQRSETVGTQINSQLLANDLRLRRNRLGEPKRFGSRAVAGSFDVVGPGIESQVASRAGGQIDGWQGRVLYVGRIDQRKGIDLLVAAIAQIDKSTVKELTIVGDGDGEELERINQQIANLQLADRVKQLGRLRPVEVHQQMLTHDLLVFPSRYPESFGLVPLEAMAAGLPVIASDCGAQNEYLTHNENSLIFKSGDSPDLAQQIRSLAVNPARRRKLVAAGVATANEHDQSRFYQAVEEEILRITSRCPPDSAQLRTYDRIGHRSWAGKYRLWGCSSSGQ